VSDLDWLPDDYRDPPPPAVQSHDFTEGNIADLWAATGEHTDDIAERMMLTVLCLSAGRGAEYLEGHADRRRAAGLLGAPLPILGPLPEPDPDPPTIRYTDHGDRLVLFEGGGSMLCTGSELDALGLMPGHVVLVRGARRTIAAMRAPLPPAKYPDGWL
jgi:hypothetical protein